MDIPDLRNPVDDPGRDYRIVARTQSIEEAERIAEQYNLQGFETRIMKKTQGTVYIYEVWASKPPDIFSTK